MSDRIALPGLIPDPVGVIQTIVADLEPDLDPSMVGTVISQVAPNRGQRQRLAQALQTDPALLASGRPEGPHQIELLIRKLKELGAQRLVLPLCYHCQRPKPLLERDGSRRICTPCGARRRAARQPCAYCGSRQQVTRRDQAGRPLCPRCASVGDHDPIDELRELILGIDPQQDPTALSSLIRTAVPQRYQRHRVLRELQNRPDLLTGAAAAGSPRVNALVAALVAAEVTGIVAPACPSCGHTARLSHQRDGLRCCRRCYDRPRRSICSRCHQRKPVNSRTPTGAPLCACCVRDDPANHEPCGGCGRARFIVHHDDGQVLCRACFRAPTATCSLCGQNKPCYRAATSTPRCENCSRQLRRVDCSRCGRSAPACSRTQTGDPLCNTCTQRREPCSSCGRVRRVAARLTTGPLCRACYIKDPASFRACTQCGQTERLHHHGLCPRCACRTQLLTLLANDNGKLRPNMEPVYEILAASDPASVLRWLRHSPAVRVLEELGRDDQPATHEKLDRHLPSVAVQYLRKVLVTGGVLPGRDERLVQLEQWVNAVSSQIEDPGERQTLRSFATWHHLRRLRRMTDRQRTTPNQAARVRAEVASAIALLTWLREQGLTLQTCGQGDIDRWLADRSTTRYRARAFVTWAAEHGHSPPLKIPSPAPEHTLKGIEHDQRWATVRRLLHDDTVPIEDRVAGLLLLLYAQSPARIAQLSRDQLLRDKGRISLALTDTPLELDPPLDELVSRLDQQRHGHAVIGRTTDHPWLFPGGASGYPITPARLASRLKALGIHPRAARNTALMDLAEKIPAAVLSRLLGLNIQSAMRWTSRTTPSSAAYADHRRHESGTTRHQATPPVTGGDGVS